MFGTLAAVAGACALLSSYRTRSPARLVWPVITVVIALFLLVPVEGHTLTYQNIGWWDTIVSAIPTDRAHWVGNWFAKLAVPHVAQHKAGGTAILAIGVIESIRARGGLARPGWGVALPLLMIATGIAFGVHGGGAEHLPSRTEQLQHWIFGSGFVIAGITLALARAGKLRAPLWSSLWAALVLALGLDFALFYRLDEPPHNAETHQHESTGSGKR